jgi:predicted nucleic acid-binding Zn ribbon protein
MSNTNHPPELDDLVRRREAARRRFYANEPKHAADIMAAVLQRRGYGRIMESEELTARWAAAVDPRLGPFTRAVRIYRRKLEVLVANSTVMSELTFAKASLLGRLNEEAAGAPITDIKFRIGVVDA